MDGTPDLSIAGALELIGDRWTFMILRDAFRGVRRFDAFRSSLGIARNVLADRLQRLVTSGILERHLYCDRPPRYEYRLTPKGVDLSPALVALKRWGDRHLEGGSPPQVFVHGECGEPLDQVLVCWHCDRTVTPAGIRSEARTA